MFFYAGAALAQPIWDSLYESQEREIGERIVMTTGLGMTESSPFGIFVTNPNVREQIVDNANAILRGAYVSKRNIDPATNQVSVEISISRKTITAAQQIRAQMGGQ